MLPSIAACFRDHWRDALDVVSVVGTVTAAWLAWIAIRRSNRQAQASAKALISERRIDFELEHLDRIMQAFDKLPNFSEGPAVIQRGLRLLAASDLPRLRAKYLGETATPPFLAELEELNKALGASGGTVAFGSLRVEPGARTYDEAVRQEIISAVESRLSSRSGSL